MFLKLSEEAHCSQSHRVMFNHRKVSKKYLKAQRRLLLTCSSGNADLELLGPLRAPDIR